MKQILPERINKQNMDDFKREVQILRFAIHMLDLMLVY